MECLISVSTGAPRSSVPKKAVQKEKVSKYKNTVNPIKTEPIYKVIPS